MKSGKTSVFLNGFIKENPILVLILGTCPTLALSTQAINGIGMGLCVTLVLMGSNIMISALKRIIPDKVRIPCYIVIISTFVTLIQLLLQAYLPELNKSLGLYIPLIVVNCIILGRAEAFANKNSVFDSMLDGLGMGLSYTVTLTIMAAIRELLGAGTVFGYTVTANLITPMSIFILAPGGFFTYGCLIALMNKLTEGKAKEKRAADKCMGCAAAQLCSQAEEGGAE
ncbi:MAG: electron transport complex subunit E [Clostridiales bacterium]|nr:electron transport complex subunit E [Clostridiales bacterium]